MHFIPAGALIVSLTVTENLRRPAVVAGFGAYLGFTVFTFVQALNGQPFL